MPRSPTETTSCRARWNIRNISAVHWPTPLTSISSAITSSSDRSLIRSKSRRPSLTRCARSRRNSTFALDSPALRRVGGRLRNSYSGAGISPPNWASNFSQIERAAFVESCWPTIARATASNGSGLLPRRSIAGSSGPCCSITRFSTLSARIRARSSALHLSSAFRACAPAGLEGIRSSTPAGGQFVRSDALNQRAGAEPAAAAHGHQAGLLVGALHLVEQRGDQARAGRAERVTERDRAAIDVDAVHVGLQLPPPGGDDGGERLIDLDEVDIVHLHPVALQDQLRG